MPTVSLHLEQSGPTAMQLKSDVHLVIDRPRDKGGGGSGLMGGQYLLAGIAGCFCSTLFAAAESRGVEIKGLDVLVQAELSERSPKRFTTIDLAVRCEDCSEPDQFSTLLTIAEKGCISVNTVKKGMTFTVQSSD